MRLPILAALACLVAAGAIARAPVDYTRGAAWLCRPGRADDACGSADLDAIRVDAAGMRTPQPFRAAAAPKIDCFYVYPTVSDDPTDYSDMVPDQSEIGVVQAQFARFASVCRPFAPVYRQLTSAGLGRILKARREEQVDIWRPALRRRVGRLARLSRARQPRPGRGAGRPQPGHDPAPAPIGRGDRRQARAAPAGRRLPGGRPGAVGPGGSRPRRHAPPTSHSAARRRKPAASTPGAPTRRTTPPCAASADWTPRSRRRGCRRPASTRPHRTAAQALWRATLHKPASAPAGDPPWVEAVGGFTAACRADAQGEVLRVSVTPAPYADMRRALLVAVQRTPGWGLHTLDVSLAQGNMLDDVAAEARAWPADAAPLAQARLRRRSRPSRPSASSVRPR